MTTQNNGAPDFYTPSQCSACGYQPTDRADEISHYTDPTACVPADRSETLTAQSSRFAYALGSAEGSLGIIAIKARCACNNLTTEQGLRAALTEIERYASEAHARSKRIVQTGRTE